MGKFTVLLKDYDGESTTTSVNVGEVTSGSFGTIVTGVASLRSAIDGVTLGLVAAETISTRTVLANPGQKAENFLAQREAKWLVRGYDDVTFAPVTFEIGTADLSLLGENSGLMDVSEGTPGAALVAAIEANVKSNNGNSVSVIEIAHVGRNI